jgi:O-methyltransferase involved in polyketide biosynthesis
MERINSNDRNYNTISPSAKSLLFMKGHTSIPFARQIAGLMAYPGEFIPDFENRNNNFWARVVHFESRYWSVDQLLTELSIKNILELSSGFSFRGLDVAKQHGIFYIDTDLPDLIAKKKDLLSALLMENKSIEGNLEILPLNALDEKQFLDTVTHFPKGEIAIVNEGLLMYLDSDEKEKLCSIIHRILKERGGYWITADIYLRNQQNKLDLKLDSKTKEFFEEHQIEENKFESFKEAETFFRRMGFVIDKEANIRSSSLSSLKYFMKSTTIKQLFKINKTGKIQVTWRLKVAVD